MQSTSATRPTGADFRNGIVKRAKLRQRAKFHRDGSNRCRDMAIFRFSKMAAATIFLDQRSVDKRKKHRPYDSVEEFWQSTILRNFLVWSSMNTLSETMNCCAESLPLRNTIHIHRESKKGATLSMAITLSILDRFAKFFHCCKEQ